MGMAEQIRQAVTMDVAARHYGFEVGRGGFMRCPFHQGDRTASLKIYPGSGGWHCFGCNKGGSVVDFVMELFGLNFKQALLRVNADFHLGLSNARPNRAAYSEMLERRQAEQREKERQEQKFRDMVRRMWWCRDVMEHLAPVRQGDEIFIHPFYEEAARELPWVEHWLDDYMRRGAEEHWLKHQSLHGTTI